MFAVKTKRVISVFQPIFEPIPDSREENKTTKPALKSQNNLHLFVVVNSLLRFSARK